MSSSTRRNAADLLDRLIEVGQRLFVGPFELDEVLSRIIEAGCTELRADRGSLLLFDPQRNELYSKASSGSEEFRFAADKGIAGACLSSRRVIRVDDCYADPRFNREIDQQTGYRSGSLISVPLRDSDDRVVGVMQVVSSKRAHFDEADERLADLLAGYAGVAIQRARSFEDRLRAAKLEEDLALAREIQMSLLPRHLPTCRGYDLAVFSQPAEETGGDIYDLAMLGGTAGESGPLLILLADATGHGIGAALTVTQVRAMFRMGVRSGLDMGSLCLHLNNQLVADLPGNKIITAFVGLLDPARQALVYHALGHGPTLHYHAATGECEWLNASTVPMGFMEHSSLPLPSTMTLEPGDVVALLSDGFLEYCNSRDEEFGRVRVGQALEARSQAGAGEMLQSLQRALEAFAGGTPQEDDLTAIILKRL